MPRPAHTELIRFCSVFHSSSPESDRSADKYQLHRQSLTCIYCLSSSFGLPPPESFQHASINPDLLSGAPEEHVCASDDSGALPSDVFIRLINLLFIDT